MTKIILIGITSTIILISAMIIFTSSSQNDAAGAVDTGINIPSWFKDVAGFYSQGAMSDEALANNIEYLIKEAIIVVPSSANYAEAKSIESALGEMQDRMNRIEMMIGNTGGNIDPSPMMGDLGGDASLTDRVSKLETMLIDTVPLPESGLGDRVSKLETMLIDTVPLPESGIDVIQKTARHIIPAGASQGKVAYCDSGYIATGGGYRYVTANHHVSDNMPLSDLKGWKVWIKNNDKYNDIKVEVYAICMKLR